MRLLITAYLPGTDFTPFSGNVLIPPHVLGQLIEEITAKGFYVSCAPLSGDAAALGPFTDGWAFLKQLLQFARRYFPVAAQQPVPGLMEASLRDRGLLADTSIPEAPGSLQPTPGEQAPGPVDCAGDIMAPLVTEYSSQQGDQGWQPDVFAESPTARNPSPGPVYQHLGGPERANALQQAVLAVQHQTFPQAPQLTEAETDAAAEAEHDRLSKEDSPSMFREQVLSQHAEELYALVQEMIQRRYTQRRSDEDAQQEMFNRATKLTTTLQRRLAGTARDACDA